MKGLSTLQGNAIGAAMAASTTGGLMFAAVKAALRRSPIYPSYFARKNAPSVLTWTKADDERLRFYRQFVGPGDLVFDVGANVGHVTKVFLRAGARVVAIEPQSIC